MPETKICYDRWIDGKPYPMSYTICDICGTRYIDPVDAVSCEKASFNPKFRLGDKVILKYDSDDYPKEPGVVLEVTPHPPRKGSNKHTIMYKVIFIGTTEDQFFERELLPAP